MMMMRRRRSPYDYCGRRQAAAWRAQAAGVSLVALRRDFILCTSSVRRSASGGVAAAAVASPGTFPAPFLAAHGPQLGAGRRPRVAHGICAVFAVGSCRAGTKTDTRITRCDGGLPTGRLPELSGGVATLYQVYIYNINIH